MKDITPALVGRASRCLHSWTLECHGNPERRSPAEPRLAGAETPEDVRRRRIVEWLPDLAEISWDGLHPKDAFQKTLGLMKQGRAWIYKGVLAREGMWGQPDLLRKVEGRSALGEYSYAPLLVRPTPGSLSKHDLFELRTHALLLEPLLRRRPVRGWAYLGPGEMVEIDLRTPLPEFDVLLSDMERVRDGGLPTEGARQAACDSCAWRHHCRTLWTDSDHLSLLPGVTPELVAPLRNAGFSTWRRIAEAAPGDLVSKSGIDSDQALDIWLHARARRKGAPVARRRPSFRDDRPLHFVDAAFVENRCVLLGSIRFHQGTSRCRQILARAATDRNEAEIWGEFLQLLARDKDPTVRPWSEPDGRRFESLWERHGGIAGVRRNFWSRTGSLRQFVRAHFALPVIAYRLDEVSALFPIRRPAPLPEHPPLRESFAEWQESSDPSIAQRLLESHREKLKSMQAIYFGLKTSMLVPDAA